MEHIGACHAHAQNPKPAEVTRTAERTASRRRQRRERAHIDSRHRFLSFVARYCATQVVTSICMAPGHTQQVSRRDGAHHQDHARTECFVMASPEDGSELLKPHRPRLSVDGRKHAHCSRRIRFIRFDRRMTSPPSPHGTAWRLRGGSLLESVLADAPVELRARQPKPPRGFRFVSSAFLQDLGNRGAFECAQVSGVVAR